MDKKTCTKCGIEKLAHEFKLNRGKLRADCKQCNKEYRTKNKTAILKKKTEYYHSHKKETLKQKIARLEAEIKCLKEQTNNLESEFDYVTTLHPEFPWKRHVAKTGKSQGQEVYNAEMKDACDSWVICVGGSRLLNQ